MANCNKCGQELEGDDCLLCKTSTSIDLSSLASDVVVSSAMDYTEACPVTLTENTSKEIFPVPVPMCRVGRDPQNDLVISGDNGISRNQFVITYEDGYFYLMDLGSRNGTMLNGRSITERTSINDGDQIQVGSLCFNFTVDAELLAQSGEADFISYLESKHDGNSNDEAFEPSMTVEVVLPDEVIAALDKAYYAQQKEHTSKHKSEKSKKGKAAEKTREEAEVIEEHETLITAVAHTEGAEQEMTVQEEPLTNAPEWCPQYMQDELSRMEKEMQDLHNVVHEAKRKIQDCEARIKIMRSLQKSLLSATGDELVEASIRVLQLMGWRIKRGEKDKQELLLMSESGGMVLTRIAWTNPQTAHVDLGTLVISQVYQWCKQKTEPKGILIVNTMVGGQDQGTAFGADLAEYARQKNVCVMSTLQLLYMFRELNQDMAHAEAFQNALISTTGVLDGFGAEAEQPAVAA